MHAEVSKYRFAEKVCQAALPPIEVYSITQRGDDWFAEIEFDNLLHDGQGKSKTEAVINALTGILGVLSPDLLILWGYGHGLQLTRS